MKKKKIVYFTDAIAYGGAEKYLKLLSLEIDKTIFDVRIAIPQRKETENFVNELLENEIKVDFVESGPNDYKSFFNCLRHFCKTKPNIIHFNLPYYKNCKYSIMAGIFYRIISPTTKLILTEHYTPINDFATGVNEKLRRYYFSKIECAIVVSKSSKKILVKKHRMPAKNIRVIYNGIDTEKFSSCNSSIIRKYEKDSAIPKNCLVFGIVARLDEIKGHRYFIEASKIVIEKYPKCKFLMIGEGDKELTQELKKMIYSLDLSEKFIFLGYQRNIAELLQIIDIFVLPSLFEGLPFSILEAMAMKKPVISTNVGGIPELVIDKTTGILVSPKNSSELAMAMIELAENYEKRINYGLTGYKRIMGKFTQKKMLTETQNLYLDSLKET